MLLEGQGVACRVLRGAGLDVGTARESIIRLVGSGAPASMPSQGLTPRCRRVVELALAHNASAVLLAHNHVSGLALPSNADLLTTETLARVLREVGVELADHLIFTEDDMVSLKDSGLLNGYPNPY